MGTYAGNTIEWKVIALKENKALVITKDIIDCIEYHKKSENVTWETCTLRKYLNGEFYQNAFSASEKQRIHEVRNVNKNNSDTGIPGGNSTNDKVFLLSIDEANNYFGSNNFRMAKGTEYAKGRGLYVNDYNGASWWWLRSPGYYSSLAAFVFNGGSVSTIGDLVNRGGSGIRPACWVDFQKHLCTHPELKIKVITEKCNGCGACEALTEGIFRISDVSEVAEVLVDKVPEDKIQEAKDAIECCHTHAIVEYGIFGSCCSEAAIGDIVKFGRYEQGIGTEPIEWRVLDKQEGKLLLLSEYGLDAKPYDKEFDDVTWETCTLRKWLNGTFFNAAFNEQERSVIAQTRCPADKNPDFETYPGNATRDNIFLLSIPEVRSYFKSKEDRMCVPTDYAIKQEAFTSDDHTVGSKATGWWWLRSPGNYGNYAVYVNYDGSVTSDGDCVFNDGICIRPALWVNP